MIRRSGAALALVAGSLLLSGCATAVPELEVLPRTRAAEGPAPTADPSQASVSDALVIGDHRIRESSGLAASSSHPGVLYTHNDRGHAADIFAVDEDGETAAVLTLDGVDAVDWEDIAVTPDGRIWVADIGDNDTERRRVSVYVAEEPDTLVDAEVGSTRYRLAYEDGPHNAEALMVHPTSGRLYLVTKESDAGGVYAAPERLRSDGVNTLTKVADSPPSVTAAAYSPDGRVFVLRNYNSAFAYTDLGGSPWVLLLPDSSKGESLTFASDGTDILVGSEGLESAVSRVRLPAALGAAQD